MGHFFQSPTGTGTLFLGIAAILTVIFKVILPNTTQVEVKLTNETINQLVQTKKPEEFLQVEKSIQKVEGNSKVPVIDRVVVEAYRLKEVGRINDSIEKWRSIANVTEGIDDNLAAQAWFAVASLFLEKDIIEQALLAYDRSIDLKPDHAATYNNRAIAKSQSGQLDAAMADDNEAIGLDPDYAEAYYNRGNAKAMGEQYIAAIADYDKTIRLKPDYIEAYNNRGNIKKSIGLVAEARIDFETVLDLGEKAENNNLKTAAKQRIQELDGVK